MSEHVGSIADRCVKLKQGDYFLLKDDCQLSGLAAILRRLAKKYKMSSCPWTVSVCYGFEHGLQSKPFRFYRIERTYGEL